MQKRVRRSIVPGRVCGFRGDRGEHGICTGPKRGVHPRRAGYDRGQRDRESGDHGRGGAHENGCVDRRRAGGRKHRRDGLATNVPFHARQCPYNDHGVADIFQHAWMANPGRRIFVPTVLERRALSRIFSPKS